MPREALQTGLTRAGEGVACSSWGTRMSKVASSLVVAAVAAFAAPALPCGATLQVLRSISPAEVEVLPSNALVFVESNIDVDVSVQADGDAASTPRTLTEGPGALAGTEVRAAPLGPVDVGVRHRIEVTGEGDEARTLSTFFTLTDAVDDASPVFAGPATASWGRVFASDCNSEDFLLVTVEAPAATDDTLVAAYSFGPAGGGASQAVVADKFATHIAFTHAEPLDRGPVTYEIVAFDVAGNASEPLVLDLDVTERLGCDEGGSCPPSGACACVFVPAAAGPAWGAAALVVVATLRKRRRASAAVGSRPPA